MCVKSEFKEIYLKLATNGRSNKGFLLTTKVCHRAIYMYKIIKNVYNIRFRRDHFETCNIWAKRKGLSVVIKFLSPMGCLPQPGAIYIWKKHIKNGKKSDLKEIFFKLATNGQRDKGFLLTSPALGLYTCIKALKYILGPGVRWAFTGPLVLWFLWILLMCKHRQITAKLFVCLVWGFTP